MHSEIGVMVSNMRTRERSTNNTITINKILVLLGSTTDKLIPIHSKFSIFSFNVLVYVLFAHFWGPHKPVEKVKKVFICLFSWYDTCIVPNQLKTNLKGEFHNSDTTSKHAHIKVQHADSFIGMQKCQMIYFTLIIIENWKWTSPILSQFLQPKMTSSFYDRTMIAASACKQ